MTTRKDLENKKEELRKEWKTKPWKREIILKQVKALDIALTFKPLL